MDMGHQFANEPSSAAAVQAKLTPEQTLDLTGYSPERQAWERLLEAHLGSYYYPIYVEAKLAGKETAWDYVEDVPGLPRVLVIGDSISRGCTLPLRQTLRGQVNLHRAPQNCSSTQVGVEKLDIWLGDGDWDLITFNFGIHDRNAPSEDYQERLAEITRRLLATGAKLVWVTTTPVPEGALEYVAGAVARVNQIATQLMKDLGIPILDLNGAITPVLDDYQLPQNCHFKEEGYAFMANVMATAIREQLQIPEESGDSR